ncbi:MAG: trypsin-like peptidase domain-containing protein [Bacteroidota bacterium]
MRPHLSGRPWMIAILLLCSCTRPILYADQEPGTGEYLTGYPIANTAPYLENMHQSIKRITSTSYYETFVFDQQVRVTPDNLDTMTTPEPYAALVVSNQTTSSGTAVVIHNRDNMVGLLTTEHTISSPDTLYEYREGEQSYLQSVTIKSSQVNWLFDAPYVGTFEVLASDATADLAVIGARVDPDILDVSVSEQFPIFPYPFGRPQKLRPGTFTYNLGFPRGYPTVTTAIVSQPKRDRNHSFVTDALFNPGFSGGVVVAINGGVPAFEWVGIARSTAASREWFMVPDEDEAVEHIPHLPYEERIYVEQKAKIHYGITHIISSTQIRNMLEEHAILLLGQGYNIIPLIQDEE